jgi:two-component system sensor histidine kinase UhpB
MQLTFLGSNSLAPTGEWWAATLMRAFTTPFWFAPAPAPLRAPVSPARSGPSGRTTVGVGSESQCFSDPTILQRTIESERIRIAQQAHDDIGSVLTGLRACIVVAQERRVRAGLPPERLLDDARTLADFAFHAVRHIATEVRPAIIDQLGVWSALDWHIGTLVRRTNMQCELRIDEALAEYDLGPARELAIYRIVQEAVTNVEKHAFARRLLISASRSDSELFVTVADDGVGLGDGRQVRADALGIRGIVEQVRAFGGTCTLHSQQDKGTAVHLTLPLENDDAG